MTGTERPPVTTLAGRRRLLVAMAGAGLLGLLGVAALLTPSGRGFGTHQQLGLPPCSFYVLYGRPCPTCGSTTAFVKLVRGDWFGALRANVGGTILGVLAAMAGPWLLLSAARGRWLGRPPSGEVAGGVAGVILAVMFVQWIIRLWVG